MKKNLKNKNIKIAISAFSDNLDGEINSRFGRCECFLFVDITNGNIGNIKAIENKQAEMRGGAGISASQMLTKHNIHSVISGNIGPKAYKVLNQSKITIYHAKGPVREALKNFIEGKLIRRKYDYCSG